MKVITARIEDKDFEDLKVIERAEQTDRAEVMRKLIAQSIREWKIKKALELLRAHRITIRKAAEIAGLSYVEMLDTVSKNKIEVGYTLKDIRADLGR
jgi:predicted HTH domain antitoxin